MPEENDGKRRGAYIHTNTHTHQHQSGMGQVKRDCVVVVCSI